MDREKKLDRIRKVTKRVGGGRRRRRRVERMIGLLRLRKKLIGKASGHVLEVACGNGDNFRFYDEDCTLVAGDLSRHALGRAAREAERVGIEVELHELDAENLPFPDASFDSVVSTMSTCMFPDPERAIREMRRVCKPDGQILLLEHGRSDALGLAVCQDVIADTHFREYRCRQNQDPHEIVKDAGAKVQKHKRYFAGMLHTFVLEPRAERLLPAFSVTVIRR